HADQRPPVPRQDLRLGDHVRGRRAANGRHLRTAELTPEVPRTADNSRRGIHVNAPLYSFSTLPGGPVSSLRERASPPFPRGKDFLLSLGERVRGACEYAEQQSSFPLGTPFPAGVSPCPAGPRKRARPLNDGSAEDWRSRALPRSRCPHGGRTKTGAPPAQGRGTLSCSGPCVIR